MDETETISETPTLSRRGTVRLTTAQALVRYLAGLRTRLEGPHGAEIVPLFGGVFAIFGHGNVAALGEALYQYRDRLPTYRAHNEQAMAHAAIAYAKAHFRRRMMACTSSIGPGATNFLTAAALAHVNRLPVLFLPGDIFVSRDPDPVLQQVESFSDGTISANDCFRPVSRYFDRILQPSQLITSLPRAVLTLTDPVLCGPATLALPQDVQAAAFDYPVEFFETGVVEFRAASPNEGDLAGAVRAVMAAKRPVLIAGGGVLYGGACEALRGFAERHGVPVCETQAGKSSLPWDHPLQLGSVGVAGSPAANALASEADLILAVGTRLADFTTGSNSLFPKARLVSLNVNPFDATKARGVPFQADARLGLEALTKALPRWQTEAAWSERAKAEAAAWRSTVDRITQRRDLNAGELPYDGEVIGAVQRSSPKSTTDDIVVCAAGTLPAELHKLWRSSIPGGYHMEYGYSCMGYEIAGGLGVKMARPDREIIVMVGDGSYLMLNSEIVTSIQEGLKLTIVLVDNHGFSSIGSLSRSLGTDGFGTQYRYRQNGSLGLDSDNPTAPLLPVDLAANAESLGATVIRCRTIAELRAGLEAAKGEDTTVVLAIEVDRYEGVPDYDSWWDVPVAEVSEVESVREARRAYEQAVGRR